MKALRQPIVCVLGHVDHGKCVDEKTLVWLANGMLRTARELYEEYESKGTKIEIKDGTVVELSDELKLLSFDGEKMISKQATHVWKKKAGHLIKIKLSNGDIIKTTPEHPFLSFNDFSLLYKRADELKQNDVVIGPSNVVLDAENNWKQEILERMANKRGFIVFIDEKKRKEFVDSLKKTNKQKLKRQGILSTTFSKTRFRAQDFVQIIKLLGFSLFEAYDWITAFKNTSPKRRAGHTSIPLRLPAEKNMRKFGYFLGAWTGDGSLQLVLHNNDVEVQKAYQDALFDVFGVSSEIKWGHTCWQVFPRAGKTLERLLSDVLEVSFKEKSKNASLPWICQTNDECFKGFIEGWFDTDGYVSSINHCIEFTTKSEKLARQVATRLAAYGIQAIVFEKNNYFFLRIANKQFLEAFYNIFSPRLKRKAERIKEALTRASSSRLVDVYPVGKETIIQLRKSLPGKVNKKLPFFSSYARKPTLPSHVLIQIAENVAKPNEASVSLQQFITKQLHGFRVTSVETCKNTHEWVYDFTVPELHNFLAERIIVHNTALLDAIRETTVAKREAGAITQAIGASIVPVDVLKKVCGRMLERLKIKLTLPGLLFIDTPGHEVFANLRKRGGSIADIAVLVIDCTKGIEAQTIEAIEILREYKTPFVVAFNKIDALTGWNPQRGACFMESIKKQRADVAEALDKKTFELIGALYARGFNAQRFDAVTDFTRELVVIPVSAKTREGLPELLLYVAGLAQKYLEKQLAVKEEGGKGSILEVREERGLGKTLDVILYEGSLAERDEIAFNTLEGPVVTQAKALLEPKPLDEMRDPREKFKPVKEVSAATGVKIACEHAAKAIPGSSVFVVRSEGDKHAALKQLEQEIREIVFETQEKGVVLKADALGSIEAITRLLKAEGIPIHCTGIGAVSHRDVAEASAMREFDKFLGVVFAFNVPLPEEVAREAESSGVKIFCEKIIYNLISGFKHWRESALEEERRRAFEQLVLPAKLVVLEKCCFRASNPCIFGVEVLEGRIRAGYPLVNEEGKTVGRIKSIQLEKESIQEARKGQQVAIALPEPFFGRQVKEKMVLYSSPSKEHVARTEEKYLQSLSDGERELLAQIKKIKGYSVF